MRLGIDNGYVFTASAHWVTWIVLGPAIGAGCLVAVVLLAAVKVVLYALGSVSAAVAASRRAIGRLTGPTP